MLSRSKLSQDKKIFEESLSKTSQDPARPKLAKILVRKRPKNHALTSPKGFKRVQIGAYIYEAGSPLGHDMSCLRYLMETVLTFGSCLVYLVKTCSLLGLVSFT